ncbi:UV excision repair protein rad23 [Balamuthia mandrillaris]
MRLNFKKLPEQVPLVLEIEENATVLDLKSKLEALHNFPVSAQKVIFAGKILADNASLPSAGVKDGSNLVLLVRGGEGGTAAAPTPTTEKPTQQQQTQEKEGTTTTTATPMEEEEKKSSEPAAASAATTATEEAAATKTETAVAQPPAELVANLTAMGFEESQAVRALRATNNNTQQACELLLSGVPLPSEEETASLPSFTTTTTTTTSSDATSPSGEEQQQASNTELRAANSAIVASTLMSGLVQKLNQTNPEDPFEWVIAQPQFQSIKRIVQGKPEMLPELMEQLGQASSQLRDLLRGHEDEFASFLMESEEEMTPSLSAPSFGTSFGGGQAASTLTQQDESSISRLMELGFSKEQAKTAFLRCAKNEEMAANFLFENS